MTLKNAPQLDQRKWERVRQGTPESRNGIRDGSLRGIYYDRYSRRYRARYADVSGNWRWQQFPTLKEAQRAKFKLEEVKENGDLEKLDRDRVTFKQLSNAYTEAHLNPPKYHSSDDGQAMEKVSGCVDYRDGRRAMKVFEDHFGNKPIRGITHNDVMKWRAARKDVPTERVNIDKDTGKRKPRSWRDVHHTLHFLRHAFNYAIEEGWATMNPASNRRVKAKLINTKLERERTRVLQDNEQIRLFRAIDDPFLKGVLIFLLNTGMRIEEAAKVERKMIDLEQNTYGHIYLPAVITKDKKARDLPILTAELREAIIDRLQAISNEEATRLFPSITDACDDAFEASRKAAGIEDFLMRDCRRTFVTRAIRVLPMAEVMKMTGHKVTKTLLRYLEPTDDAHKANAARFEAYMIEKATIDQCSC